jgi:pyocin large subunit-like protein
MNKKTNTVLGSVLTVLVILVILFVRSPLFDKMFGNAEDEVTILASSEKEPEATKEPKATKAPEATKEPKATKEPEATKEPKATKEPEATKEPKKTEAPKETEAPEVIYKFRSKKLLNEHYEKHGEEMGFASAQEYEAAASAVVTNPDSLHKTEKEDGDDVYYLEATNEFVIVSKDGYLRTYFLPSAGKKYYDRQ